MKREQDANSAIVADFFYSYREGEFQKKSLQHASVDSLRYPKPERVLFFFHFQPEHRALLQERSHFDFVERHYRSLKNVLLSLRDHPRAEQLYLIIDAMDESDNKDRREILQLLFDLCSGSKHCVIKVFVASRPVTQLEYRSSEFHNFIRLQDETKPDILRFASSCLKDLNFTSFLERATEYIVKHLRGTSS